MLPEHIYLIKECKCQGGRLKDLSEDNKMTWYAWEQVLKCKESKLQFDLKLENSFRGFS